MRVRRLLLLLTLALACAPGIRAEYVVLRSGQRLRVTGYQLQGDQYKLQINGGLVVVLAVDVVAVEPEEVFVALPAEKNVAQGLFADLIQEAAKRYSVDADLITSVIAAESNFDPKAVSRRDARGLMQLLPVTAARFGVRNIFDPRENIDAGTHYLHDLLELYKNDLALTLAAYNAGPERVQQYGRVPPFTETVSYVRRVKQTYQQRKSAAPAGAPPAKIAAAAPAPAPSAGSQ